MNKRQLSFLKLLKKHGTMTAPQICQKLDIKKSTFSTDYAELLQYINYPDSEHKFDSFFTIKHYTGDAATSCKSEFSLTTRGDIDIFTSDWLVIGSRFPSRLKLLHLPSLHI